MKSLTLIFTRLLNLGVLEEDSALYKLRARSLNLFNYFTLLLLIYFSCYFIIYKEVAVAFYQLKVNIIDVIVFGISIAFAANRWLNVSVMISGVFTVFTISSLTYGTESFFSYNTSAELGIIMAFVILVIEGFWSKVIFLGLSAAITGYITFDMAGDYALMNSFLRSNVLVTSGFLGLVIMLERIDKLLSKTLSDLKISNEKNILLNRELKERNEELVDLTHMVTHDLKTPLRAINSFSNVLSHNINFKDTKEAKYFSYITDSSKSMESLLEELLNFMMIENESNTSQYVSLNEVVDEVISDFQFEVLQRKAIIKREELPSVNGNKQLLKSVFQNLISNALKYQPTDPGHSPSILIAVEDTSDSFDISVKDNGIGIDKEFIPLLFEPFKKLHSSAEYKGTGLGMSICKRAMAKMHGEIELACTSEKGSEFKLHFLKAEHSLTHSLVSS